MKLAVNGRFLAAPVTGVQRVARQLIVPLTDLVDITLYLPRGVKPPAGLESGTARGLLPGVPWEQLELPVRTLRDGVELSLDPANAGPVFGGPRVLILHDVFPLTHPEWYTPSFRRWFRLVVARAARRARRVVMFSEWAKCQAVQVLGLEGARVTVATQGTGPFDGPPDPATVRTTLGRLGVRPGYILASGEGDGRKNVGFLLDTIRSMGDDAPPVVLTGASVSHVHAPAAASGRLPAVRRLGFVSDDELRSLYAGAAAFCFPSRAEGFGRAPLEAMACGTPVLAAAYGCAREVLGDAAEILPLDRPAWVEALAALLDDGAERRRRVESGRAHAARYRWEDTARQVVAACRAALGESPGTGPAAARARGGG